MTTWSILIPTIGQREPLFLRLMDALMPQVDQHAGQVNVIAWRNAGNPPLGQLRDEMLACTDADYVSFIDDDDLVAPDYVADIVAALEDKPDHVGFQLEYCVDGVPQEIVDHSLKHRRWHRNAEGRLLRDFTHVDPIRRDIAVRGRFGVTRRGRAEDRVWCRQIRPLMHNERYVDKVLYHYLWSATGTSWQRPERVMPPATSLPRIPSGSFRWHPASV